MMQPDPELLCPENAWNPLKQAPDGGEGIARPLPLFDITAIMICVALGAAEDRKALGIRFTMYQDQHVHP